MADFSGYLDIDHTLAAKYTGRGAASHTQALIAPSLTVDTPSALDPSVITAGSFSDTGTKPPKPAGATVSTFDAVAEDRTTPAEDWFDSFHVIPRSLAFGNLLTAQVEPIEVYSAWRRAIHDWTLFTNNAGAGITLLNQPTLPETFQPHTGVAMSLQVDTDGPATVNSTLEFVFGTVPQTIFIPITLERIILFVPEPELPYMEELEFLTDVFLHKDGTEQRASARKNPRQFFQWRLILDDGPERSKMHNILFEWQVRTFGIPEWHDLTKLTTAAAVDDTVINVRNTTYGDFRDSGLVALYTDADTFDVHEITSSTATTITLSSALLNAHPVGTKVVPVVTAVMDAFTQGRRFPTSAADIRVKFRVTDNDVSIADTSAFSVFNSKVLIDGHNAISGAMQEVFEQQLIAIDGATGLTEQSSSWANGRHVSGLGLFTQSRQGLWEVRQLLHALRGRQVSFYVSSFAEDMLPVENLASGSNILTVANVGYNRYIQNRQPRDVIRVVFNDGTADILRTVTGSTEIDSTKEQLTLDSTWASTYTVASVRRIEFVEKVRFNSDRIRLHHNIGDRNVKISAPIKAVLE